MCTSRVSVPSVPRTSPRPVSSATPLSCSASPATPTPASTSVCIHADPRRPHACQVNGAMNAVSTWWATPWARPCSTVPAQAPSPPRAPSWAISCRSPSRSAAAWLRCPIEPMVTTSPSPCPRTGSRPYYVRLKVADRVGALSNGRYLCQAQHLDLAHQPGRGRQVGRQRCLLGHLPNAPRAPKDVRLPPPSLPASTAWPRSPTSCASRTSRPGQKASWPTSPLLRTSTKPFYLPSSSSGFISCIELQHAAAVFAHGELGALQAAARAESASDGSTSSP